jgi:hypothetical protein
MRLAEQATFGENGVAKAKQVPICHYSVIRKKQSALSEQFHIPTEWPVLVVEDTEDRISWFRQRLPKATFAKCAKDAFHALGQHEFKVIFLDHDLHWMHADNSIFTGTGKEIARFLANMGFQGIVIIHSRHMEGAEMMKKYLPMARLAPFGSFDIVSEVNL